MRLVTTLTEAFIRFDEMVSGTQQKYFMLGGKRRGVGKTSCAASLVVKFANHGHPSLVVSTDHAHSLSEFFDQVHTAYLSSQNSIKREIDVYNHIIS